MPKVEEYTDADAFLKALGRRPRTKRVSLPRAPNDERVGLSPLIKAGWNYWYDAKADTHRLYKAGRDTGACATLRAACEKAKEINSEPH